MHGYLPERGDIVWLTFDPQVGREQAGRRPALVVSPAFYNAPSGLALVCPVTSRPKGYPFEVTLPTGLAISGVVLADHVKSADWEGRKAELACKAPCDIVEQVIAKIETLLR